MLLFVGLGNPGAKYAGNRHNIGFMAVRGDRQAPRLRAVAPALSGRRGGRRDRRRARLLLLPGTFMNESGRAVAEAVHFYKLALADIVVFHDELDLPPGKVRVKTGGGNAGHNGLRSITAHVGNDYRRVRIGIGHPGDKDMVQRYVLSDFAKSERPWVEALMRRRRRQRRAAGRKARMRASRTRCISPWPPRASVGRTTRPD